MADETPDTRQYEEMPDEELYRLLGEKCPAEIEYIPAVTAENRQMVIAFLRVFADPD